ncbi:MAG: nucleotidyltransferase family protein [Chloroflexi bacterium]|nr:nucleotidyltransferase family protein [Chloroflexota bacterium]
MTPRIAIDRQRIAEFCRRHQVKTLALFGSVLRDDFRPASDVDVLVDLEPDAKVSLFEFAGMQDELAAIFGREVDLVEKRGLRNPFRRRAILETAEEIYAA